ncbi:MAG TPA: hypothetical protein PKA10_07580 [Selenomonadales bacterium]|nr:hypothetical protein [Selenomonadales bacterium]
MKPESQVGPLRIAATFAGTIIGAGFASGQEIVQFFVSFGFPGLGGVLLASLLFGWLGGRLLELGRKLKATTHSQAIYYLCGRRFGLLLDWATSFFLFGTLSIMLAGAATVGRDYFDLPYLASMTAASLAVAATVLCGVRGISAANMIITPLLTLSIVGISFYSFVYHPPDPSLLVVPSVPEQQAAPHWLLASMLYVSYNLMISSTVLVPLGGTLRTRRAGFWGGAVGGLVLGALAALLASVVMLHHPEILSYEVPILEVASRQHDVNSSVYAVTLLAAMYTTAIATLFGCATKLKTTTGLPPAVAVPLLVLAALGCGQLGFANLIRLLFPLFGATAFWFTVRLACLAIRGR